MPFPVLVGGGIAAGGTVVKIFGPGLILAGGGIYAYIFASGKSKKEQEKAQEEVQEQLKKSNTQGINILKQPTENGNLLHQVILEHHDTILSQATEQQESLGSSIQDFKNMANSTETITEQLSNLADRFRNLADSTELDAQAIQQQLHSMHENLMATINALKETQTNLSEKGKRFSGAVAGLTATEASIASSCEIGYKIIELSELELKTLISCANEPIATENVQLKKFINDLLQANSKKDQLLIKLSEQNAYLKSQNTAEHPQEQKRSTSPLRMF